MPTKGFGTLFIVLKDSCEIFWTVTLILDHVPLLCSFCLTCNIATKCKSSMLTKKLDVLVSFWGIIKSHLKIESHTSHHKCEILDDKQENCNGVEWSEKRLQLIAIALVKLPALPWLLRKKYEVSLANSVNRQRHCSVYSGDWRSLNRQIAEQHCSDAALFNQSCFLSFN